MSTPKFYVGQRVVAIENHPQGLFKEGDEFTVTSIVKGCCYDFGITIGISHIGPCTCGNKYDGEWRFMQSRFAPIIENFQAITFEKIVEHELTSVN